MGARKSPNISSDRQKWNHIFNALDQMLQTQQSQLKFFEYRLKLQHERWIFDVMLSQEQLSQMRRKINVLKMEGTVEAAKSDLFMGLKQNQTLKIFGAAWVRRLKKLSGLSSIKWWAPPELCSASLPVRLSVNNLLR